MHGGQGPHRSRPERRVPVEGAAVTACWPRVASPWNGGCGVAVNITRTIQRHEDPKWVASFFDRSLEGEKAGWFPLPQVPRKAKAGDWVYVIYRGRIYGRLQITEVRRVNRADPVGSR